MGIADVSAKKKSMKTNHLKKLDVVLITAVLVFLVGCGSIRVAFPPDKEEPPDLAVRAEAQAILSTLGSRNAQLKNFKGVGTVRVWQEGKLKIDERIAWVGSDPGKINIAVLIGGHPAVKMASDGKWFYYYEAGKGGPVYKKYRASNASLKRLISIAIQTDDVLNLLAGRVPIRDHHSVMLQKLENEPGYALVLKKRWWGVIQKIFLNESKTRAQKIEFFNRSGTLIYRARFDTVQTINSYLVPSRLNITNDKEVQFELDINRYLADVEVTSSMFVLKPPN